MSIKVSLLKRWRLFRLAQSPVALCLGAMKAIARQTPKPAYLLTAAQMQRADARTMASGVVGYDLMQRAGQAAADVIMQCYEKQPVLVLAGTGNNGGDGYVIARLLEEQGWNVRLAALEGKEPTTRDAKLAAQDYAAVVEKLTPQMLAAESLDDYLIVDALFGTGLARPTEGIAAAVIAQVNAVGGAVVAIDIPSGIDATTGAVLGVAMAAELTISFASKKRGHLLMPGLDYCGEVVVCDIGIEVELESDPVYENEPELWAHQLLWPTRSTHKYQRGHVAVVAGNEAIGASRLAAMAALRSGAGLSSILCESQRFDVYAAMVQSLMVKPMDEGLDPFLADDRINAYVIGPGAVVHVKTRQRVLAIVKAQKKAVLDADALRVFSETPGLLFGSITAPTVLTPHEGEFSTLFANTAVDRTSDKITRVIKAAEIAGAVVVLKGADTVIASPDGRAAVNGNAPPWLATAGTGDVLAGTIAGFLAQGMDAFEAACAGVWFHGDAAQRAGIGMIAEDLPQHYPAVWQGLQSVQSDTI